MKRWKQWVAALMLSPGMSAWSGELVWNYSTPESMPKPQNGAHIRLSDAKTPDGKAVLQIRTEFDSEALLYQPVITFMTSAEQLRGAKTVELSFYCRAEFPGTLEIRSTSRSETSIHLTDTATLAFGTEWKRLTCVLKVSSMRSRDPYIQFPRILLNTVKEGKMIELGLIAVRTVSGEGAVR